MASSHETNPNTKKSTSSKKHKSKSGKSGHKHSEKSGQRDEHREELHEVSGQTQGQDEHIQDQPEISGRVAEQPEASGQEQAREAKRKGKKKKVQFAEEPSSRGKGLRKMTLQCTEMGPWNLLPPNLRRSSLTSTMVYSSIWPRLMN